MDGTWNITRLGSPRLLDQSIFWGSEGKDSILLLGQLDEVYEIIVKFITLEKPKIYYSD